MNIEQNYIPSETSDEYDLSETSINSELVQERFNELHYIELNDNIANIIQNDLSPIIHFIHILNTEYIIKILELFYNYNGYILIFDENSNNKSLYNNNKKYIHTKYPNQVLDTITNYDIIKIIIYVSINIPPYLKLYSSNINLYSYSHINMLKELMLDNNVECNNVYEYPNKQVNKPSQKNINSFMEEDEVIKFDNNYVIKQIDENKKNKTKKIIEELKLIYPLTEDMLIKLYNKSISIHQSNIQGNGDFLENNILVSQLLYNNIPFKQQVTINKDGLIVGFNEKKSKCYHIVDFVIGDNIKMHASITEYKVISCKTTCRERWTQDDWTFTYSPLKYILLTISNDYPNSTRFRETDKRKIITCYPKMKDDRKYKLNFENIIDELI